MQIKGLALIGTHTMSRAPRSAFVAEVLGLRPSPISRPDVESDEVSSNGLQRYVHFRAPDGRLYELIETIG